MTVISRVDVHESECIVVLQYFKARHLSGDDLAKDAVGISFHIFPRKPGRVPLNQSFCIAVRQSGSLAIVQCDISTGSVMLRSSERVAPPSNNSRAREWP